MRGDYCSLLLLLGLLNICLPAGAQMPAGEGASAAQLILHNGKIATMSDSSFQPNPVMVAQAKKSWRSALESGGGLA